MQAVYIAPSTTTATGWTVVRPGEPAPAPHSAAMPARALSAPAGYPPVAMQRRPVAGLAGALAVLLAAQVG